MAVLKDISSGILGKVKELVLATDSEAEVFLFGSRARGDAREDSDWDILILTPKWSVNLKVEQAFRHKLDLRRVGNQLFALSPPPARQQAPHYAQVD